MSFNNLGLIDKLVNKCKSLGYTEPTAIQKRAIPAILSGKDLIGCAATGTGKTAAFLLPIIQRYTDSSLSGTQILILASTRELALQIESSYLSLVVKKSARCVALIGGESISNQIAALRRRPHIVIATPGRLMDHIERKSIDLTKIEVLVLDEADRMLDMGFWPTVKRLLTHLPSERQTLMFSATMSSDIERLAHSIMQDPTLVEVSPRGKAASTVDQKVYSVAMESKTALLLNLLERGSYERVLVFTRTRRGAERLSGILQAREHKANRIHADRTQGQRESALRGFKDGHHRVLVATDIAARGIDVDSVSHVINYDIPATPEDYVHRIGRTGRAGNRGCAITLVTPSEELAMKAIERLTGQIVERVFLPAFGEVKSVSKVLPATTISVPNNSRAGRSFRPRRASR
jgi:ATP-dependent RNA helicase RhlE